METKQQIAVTEIELSYRSKVKASDRPVIIKTQEAYELLISYWDKNKIELVEEAKVLFMNKAHKVLGLYHHSSGSASAVVIDIKLILAAAVKLNACCMIIAHNHPSGNLTSSFADRMVTVKLMQACKYFDIELLDHLIITPHDGFHSIIDEGIS